jgi:hypothetical protein
MNLEGVELAMLIVDVRGQLSTHWVIDDVARLGDVATSRCWLMMWLAQWLVVGSCMVADLQLRWRWVCAARKQWWVVRTRQSDVATVSSHE